MLTLARSGAGDEGSIVYLARHAQSLWNGTRKVGGQLNLELSEKGLEQTKWLARLFDNRPLDRIYASDLKRAAQTAGAVAKVTDLSVQEKPALRKFHFGVLQGRYRDQRDLLPLPCGKIEPAQYRLPAFSAPRRRALL